MHGIVDLSLIVLVPHPPALRAAPSADLCYGLSCARLWLMLFVARHQRLWNYASVCRCRYIMSSLPRPDSSQSGPAMNLPAKGNALTLILPRRNLRGLPDFGHHSRTCR